LLFSHRPVVTADAPQQSAVRRRHDAIRDVRDRHKRERYAFHQEGFNMHVDAAFLCPAHHRIDRRLIEPATDEAPIIGHAEYDVSSGGHSHCGNDFAKVVGGRLELEALVFHASEGAPESALIKMLDVSPCDHGAQQLSEVPGRTHGFMSAT
jgi:hypothetical protein